MMSCTFFGHRECYGLDEQMLRDAIERLITNGVTTFYVGNQGDFDGMVFRCLTQLEQVHPHISCSVVLAYLPKQKQEYDSYAGYSLYPEGLETVPPRFAIDKRNRWMIERAEYCVCYVNNTFGGAYKFARTAKRTGLTVINLGRAEL